MKIECQHFDGTCRLGLFGGKPHQGNCKACIEFGENNQEYANSLFASYQNSHPLSKSRISGCCDSAQNYVNS